MMWFTEGIAVQIPLQWECSQQTAFSSVLSRWLLRAASALAVPFQRQSASSCWARCRHFKLYEIFWWVWNTAPEFLAGLTEILASQHTVQFLPLSHPAPTPYFHRCRSLINTFHLNLHTSICPGDPKLTNELRNWENGDALRPIFHLKVYL